MRRHDPGSTRVTVFNQREVEPSRSVVSATMLGMGNPIWTDQLAAWSALVSAALTLGLLVFAVFAWRTAHRTLEESRKASVAAQKSAEAAEAANEQLRRDSIGQTRPYVFAEILPGLAGVTSWDIRITNAGKSSARELTLRPLKWPNREDTVMQSLRELMETPRTLPPGCSIRALWRLGPPEPGTYTKGAEEMGMDERGQVSVMYRSDDRDQPAYVDVFDVNTHGAGLWPVPEAGPAPDDLKGDLRKFYKLGQALVRRVGELGR
ncbi:MAG: hypothetical protein VB093_15010 [Propionicimonas sp.]|nr:hypothetical protein [Propionicimonas sp.]